MLIVIVSPLIDYLTSVALKIQVKVQVGTLVSSNICLGLDLHRPTWVRYAHGVFSLDSIYNLYIYEAVHNISRTTPIAQPRPLVLHLSKQTPNDAFIQ